MKIQFDDLNVNLNIKGTANITLEEPDSFRVFNAVYLYVMRDWVHSLMPDLDKDVCTKIAKQVISTEEEDDEFIQSLSSRIAKAYKVVSK